MTTRPPCPRDTNGDGDCGQPACPHCAAAWRPVNPDVCKHAGPDALIVERNQGYRWVTCTLCLTEFVPVDRYHVVDLGASDFSVQHPVTCRPDLTACDVHTWLHSLDEPPAPPGRYRIEQADILHGGFTLTAEPDGEDGET